MISFIEGILVEKTPTYAIIDCNGVGYLLHISLNTYTHMPEGGRCRLYAHQIIREDAHLLFGFMDQEERTLFRYLLTVQGVGANTARMILSSLSVTGLCQAIIQNQAATLQSVKGIGGKTAQKIILELRDKIRKEEFRTENLPGLHNTTGQEALSALVMLGFPRNQAEKAVHSVLRSGGDGLSVEDLIKAALKIL